MLGTLRYMSPEQARGQAVDHRSDIFSLGIVLYEMVTGQLPFSGASALDTLHAIAFEETRPMTALRPNLPPSLQRVVTRCLRKRAPDRYPDAKELVSDLKTVQREVESGISSRVSLAARLQERWRQMMDRSLGEWLLPGGILVLVLAVVIALSLRALGRRDRTRPGVLRDRVAAGVAADPQPQDPPGPPLRGQGEARSPRSGWSRSTACASRVVADQAQARTYVRANAALDSVNASMFFGEPFTLVVRDAVSAEEEKALLAGPGILYVREQLPGAAALPAPPPLPPTTPPPPTAPRPSA